MNFTKNAAAIAVFIAAMEEPCLATNKNSRKPINVDNYNNQAKQGTTQKTHGYLASLEPIKEQPTRTNHVPEKEDGNKTTTWGL